MYVHTHTERWSEGSDVNGLTSECHRSIRNQFKQEAMSLSMSMKVKTEMMSRYRMNNFVKYINLFCFGYVILVLKTGQCWLPDIHDIGSVQTLTQEARKSQASAASLANRFLPPQWACIAQTLKAYHEREHLGHLMGVLHQRASIAAPIAASTSPEMALSTSREMASGINGS